VREGVPFALLPAPHTPHKPPPDSIDWAALSPASREVVGLIAFRVAIAVISVVIAVAIPGYQTWLIIFGGVLIAFASFGLMTEE
jgi:hypothetical protein